MARSEYKIYEPTAPDVFVACTEELTTGPMAANYTNWLGKTKPRTTRSTYDESDASRKLRATKDYKDSREVRPTGMPTQVMLHETAGFGDLSLGYVRSDANKKKPGRTHYIPHFCVNKVDKKRMGNILQYVDVAERTSHAVPLNDRSIGIEFVNAPYEAALTPHLDKKTTGVYLETILIDLPERERKPRNDDVPWKLFLPLELYPLNDETAFALTIPEEALINKKALAGFKVGPSKDKVAETTGGVVTVKSCRSDMFEHLVGLLALIQNSGRVPGLDLTDPAQHHNVVKRDGKDLFIYQHAWTAKDDTTHFAVDIRLGGVMCHGLIGGHWDGFTQALYVYLRFVRQMPPRNALQQIINLLVRTKANAKLKRPNLDLPEKATLKAGVEEDPAKPMTIKVENYLDIS